MRQNESFTTGLDKVWNQVADPLQQVTAMRAGPFSGEASVAGSQKTEPRKARIKGYFNVGAGLEIVGKGGKDIFSGGVGSPISTTTRLWYLENPILAAYHLPMSNSASLIIQAAPYFGSALEGQFKDDQGTQKVTFGKQGDFTRGDYGIQVHVGYS